MYKIFTHLSKRNNVFGDKNETKLRRFALSFNGLSLIVLVKGFCAGFGGSVAVETGG